MRAVFSLPIAAGGADEADHAGHRRVLQDDGESCLVLFGHGGERNVLPRLGLAEDEAGSCSGKNPFGMIT